MIWWLAGKPRLSARARSVIGSRRNEILVSAASVWEIALKARSGKLSLALDAGRDLLAEIADQGFLPLAVTWEQAHHTLDLGGAHRDPFDLLLISQALLEKLTVVGADAAFDAYGVHRIW